MRLTSIASLSAALLIAAPATAQGTSQVGSVAASATKAAKPADAEKKICKRLATSGTRMEQRVCLTKEEWKQVEKEVKG